jgi:long-chain fatty acid transport protein
LGAHPARANPLDTFGFGSRPTAMGGAVSADAPDGSAGYYNPACLAAVKRLDISVGYFTAVHQLAINGKDTAVDPVRGLAGGFVAPGTIFGFPFAFGIAIHLPDDRLSRVRALRQETPRWELYDNRNQRLYLAANVALGLLPFLEVGGGVSFMSSTQAALDITGAANIINPVRSELRHQVDASLGAIRYPQFGARLRLRDDLALALVYRGQFKLDLDLRARLQGDISVGAGPLTSAYYALHAFSVNAFLPQQVVLGTSYRPASNLHLNLDFTWINWSAYIAPVAKLDVELNIPPPAGGWPAGIQPPMAPAPTPIAKMQIVDRVVPHIGVEWRAVKRRRFEGFVRGGYEFARSPIGEQIGITNYVDRDRHSISAGFGLRGIEPLGDILGDVRFDMHAQLSILPQALTRKADPSDFVGDYVAGGSIWNVGATLSVGF